MLEAVRISAIVEKLSKRGQLDLAHGRSAAADSLKGVGTNSTGTLGAKAGVRAEGRAGSSEIIRRRGAVDRTLCMGMRLWDAAEGVDVLLLLAGVLVAFSAASLLRGSFMSGRT